MKYKCLVLDHDDTVVDSTSQIHFPSFVEFLKIIRPGLTMTFEEYMRENFNPGFSEMCYKHFNFTEIEMNEEVEFWREYVKEHIPVAYKGFKQVLYTYKQMGGVICVVSHSLAENIRRDYRANHLPIPDEVFGWEQPPEERKPAPHSLCRIMKKYGFIERELLMVDDLKPGLDMARACNVDFAAAGWAYELPEIKEYMKKNSDYYLKDVEELRRLIF